MAINIKDPETDRLARELAAQRGQPITDVVRDALLALKEADAQRHENAAAEKLAAMMKIIEEMDKLPILDKRDWREILDEAWGDDLK